MLPEPIPGNSNTIKYRTLGRTGLRVSQIGLGGGGKSCLGRKKGKPESESVRLVERAIELGINLIDTSGRNLTESIIGRGIHSYDRDGLVLSTKRTVSEGTVLNTASQFADSLEDSLRALDTPYIDIMHFHGVLPDEYDYVVAELLPVMEKFKVEGKIRHIGLTEIFERDRNHVMLRRALADNYWDVMMVGFNMINQSARDLVFAAASEKNIGILGMFAVRRALTSSEAFTQTLRNLQSAGMLPTDLDVGSVLARLTDQGAHRRTLAEIAYLYCRDEPAIQSVLMGTGEISHLEENVQTFGEPPLADDTRRFIAETFGHISDFSGN
jgi:L-galactose dehydrogenase